jgi:hypothetical protein
MARAVLLSVSAQYFWLAFPAELGEIYVIVTHFFAGVLMAVCIGVASTTNPAMAD